MPKVTASGTLGGRPIISVQSALEMLARNGIDDAGIRGRANSFRCPIGEDAGRGWVLMLRPDVEAIAAPSSSGLSSLELTLMSGSMRISFPSVLLVKAYRLIPGKNQSGDSLYLVEIADKRWLAERTYISRRFNLRLPNYSGVDYVTETTNGGTPWTWDEIVEVIWGLNLTSIIGSYSAGSVSQRTPTITSTPENLWYEGTTSWKALCDVLQRTGREIRYDPIADQFSAVQMGNGTVDANARNTSPANEGGAGDSINGLTDGPTIRRGVDQLLEDGEAIIGPHLYPAGVAVFFPTSHSGSDQFNLINDEYGSFYPVGVLGSSLTTGSDYSNPGSTALPGSTVILFDQMIARFDVADDTTPANDANLLARAEEIAEDYYRTLVDDTPARWVFSGARDLVPGPFISEVIWRDYGDGLKTEVTRYRPNIGKLMPQRIGPTGFQWGRGRLDEDLLPSVNYIAVLSVYRWDGSDWVDTGVDINVLAGLTISQIVPAGSDIWYAVKDGRNWALLQACADDTTTTTTTAAP